MRAPRLLRVSAGILLAATSLPAGEPASYRVMLNASNPVTSMARSQVSSLFLKNVSVWPDGRPVLPVDLTEDSPTRQTFSKDIHRRSVAAIKSFWQQKIFSGREVPPPELPSDAEVIAYVKAHAGAVGYVAQTPSDSGVKVLNISSP